MYFIVHNGQKQEYSFHLAKRFKMAITRLYIAKTRIFKAEFDKNA